MASRRAAVLGSPISHSRSPVLHRAAYAALGLDWSYDAIEVSTDGLPEFLDSCHWPEWAGLSLTMPLKTGVLPLLDHVSQTAAVVGAANTVVFGEDGRSGHNTDVAGMQRSLREAHGGDLALRRGVIIGSGATARSALAALAGLGATDVVVMARTPEKAAGLLRLGVDLGVAVTVSPWEAAALLDSDAVIATVPPGAADGLVASVPAGPGVLLDVAYGAGETPLSAAWAGAGGAVADGLDLLLWQAVDQVHLMTGLEAPAEAMRAALDADAGTSTR
jgi:shikimate dehydrogenase